MEKILIWFIVLFSLLSFSTVQQPEVSQEYQVKAAFLFNFAQFVEWPADAFSEAQSPLVIGVLGEDPFGTLLEETVSGEKSNGHPLVVAHFKTVEEAKNCHILFVNLPREKKQAAILSSLKGSGVLTVSDGESFTKDGGMVRFTTEKNRVHLKINLTAVKEDNLSISSKLLRLAEIVTKK